MAKAIIKEIFKAGGIEIKRYNRRLEFYHSLYTKYHHYTMIPKEYFMINLAICENFAATSGSFVECGVWRGGMSAAIAEILESTKKDFHLFDSFEGLPPAKEIDGLEALQWQSDVTSPNFFDNCKADEEMAVAAMTMSNCKDYQIYKGWFDQTLPTYKGGDISILRLDADWYDSIMVCMKNLYPRVVTGGVVIIDDYYTWDGCSKAIHDYLSSVNSSSRVFQWNNEIAYLIKKD
jgi:O-methyltransferase